MSRVSLGCWTAVVLLLACKTPAPPAPPAPPPPEAPAPAPPAAEATLETPAPLAAACRQDSDCALTRVPEGDSCPKLCTPRAVLAAEARELEVAVERCEREGRPCPLPSCRAAMTTEVGCTAGKCVSRRVDDR